MAITYAWQIAAVDCYPEHEGNTDVVFTVHWRLNGADGDHAAGVYGTVGLTLDPDAEFTAFADLTEEQVVGWAKDAMGADQVAAHEDNVAGQIAALIDPPVTSPALPWA